MNYPVVAVGIITYNREQELTRTIASMINWIQYPKDKLIWVLSDDGSPPGMIDRVLNLFPDLFSEVLTHQRGGLGVNWNGMIEACQKYADLTLCNQDDWTFTTPLDLRLAVGFMRHNPDYGMLRYHKLTGHVGLPMVMKEWDTRAAWENYNHNAGGGNEYHPSMLPYMELLYPFDGNTYSPYSGGVHLRHRDFTKIYGGYSEGVGFSSAEQEYMYRVNECLRGSLWVGARQRVAMFPSYIESRFQDLTVGNSYRNTAIEAETLKIKEKA